MGECRLVKGMLEHIYDAHHIVAAYDTLFQTMEIGRESAYKELENSGLRGRGGAAFPTYIKWQSVKNKENIILICNADEGEPGTFKDRYLIEGSPHLLIESLLIGAYILKAKEVYIYIRGEYVIGQKGLRKALQEIEPVLDHFERYAEFRPSIRIATGGGAYVCGDETSLINSLEGKRPSPRIKPPLPIEAGLRGMPTIVNNVETLVNVNLIMKIGGGKYSEYGRGISKGTKLISLSGKVKNPGVYEVEFGSMTFRQIIEEFGGGVMTGPIKFIIPGGVSTQLLASEGLDTFYDIESCQEAGTNLGSGALIVADQTVDAFDISLNIADFFMKETCGTCFPCKEGNRQVHHLLSLIGEGKGEERYLELIGRVTTTTSIAARCGLGKSTGNFITSAIDHFPEDFLNHIKLGMMAGRM